MLWLAVHFPQLQLDSLCGVDADADYARVVEAAQCVVQVDELARAQGVQKGMTVSSAAALVDKLRVSEYAPVFEQARLNELAGLCYDFSSDVVVRQSTSTLLIEVSGMLRLFKNSLQLYLIALQEVFSSQQVCIELALARSPLAAELLACHMPFSLDEISIVSNGTTSKESGEASSETNSKQSQAISASSESRLMAQVDHADNRLAGLAIEHLDISVALKNKLLRLGLKTLDDLRALPKPELAMRAGTELVMYLASLAADASPVLPRFKPPEYFKQSIAFDEEIFTAPVLLFPLRRVLGHLERYLQQRALCTNGLRLHLVHRGRTRQTLSIDSASPEYREEHWHGLIRLKLEQLRLEQPVLGMELEAQELLAIEGESADLFERSIAPHRLANVLSRIEAKLGKHTVQQAGLVADHAPEYSFAYKEIDLKARQASWQVEEPLRSYSSSTLRPSLLFDEPRALAEAIRIVHGPERIQTGWWREQEICRDYFVAVNLEKQLLWVFRDRNQRWFVHGLFA